MSLGGLSLEIFFKMDNFCELLKPALQEYKQQAREKNQLFGEIFELMEALTLMKDQEMAEAGEQRKREEEGEDIFKIPRILKREERIKKLRSDTLLKKRNVLQKKKNIALVQLEEKSPGYCIGFSNSISPICLPGALETDDNNGHCQIAGWGHMYEGADKFSVYLQEADVPIIPHEQCHSPEVHGSQITQDMLCAGYLEGRIDACQGDSGGPLVCEEQGKATIRGIVSWSTGCAQRNKPGVYTNVARYLSWIQSNMH